jgi:hypothetical protein
MSREGERTIAIGGNFIGNAFGLGSNVINISGDNYGVVGGMLSNCIDMIQKEASEERRSLLEDLQADVRKLIDKLPADKQDEAPQVAEDLEMLVKQATSEKPNRKRYTFSAEGLLDASKWVKDFAGNISGPILSLGKAIWPDFKLPGSN